MATVDPGDAWYWCVKHERVEKGAETCPGDDRMGPYETEQAAQNWRDLVDARNERWDEEDREWSGEVEK